MKNETKYLIRCKGAKCAVGSGYYHWTPLKKARHFTLEEAEEMLLHIFGLDIDLDAAAADIYVTPTTGGTKETVNWKIRRGWYFPTEKAA